MDTLPHLTTETGPRPQAAVIWLHGLGVDGHDFESIVPQLNLPEGLAVRFIFPHAPVQPVTINGGMFMPAWYDILAMEIEREVDEEGVRRSMEEVEKLVQVQVEKGIPKSQIVLAGFSQGGAVVSSVVAESQEPYAGLMALSTYLPVWPETTPSASKATPVFIGHGNMDPVVPMELGQKLQEYFEDWGFAVEFEQYPMEHSVHPQEIQDIRDFLVKCLVK